MQIGVIGLGKLGFCLASILNKHFDVVGVDLDKELVSKINKNKIPYDEPNLTFFHQKPFKATTSFKQLSECKVIFIIVPTNSLKDGSFSNKEIVASIKQIVKYNKKALINIVSTVMPGTCQRLSQLYKRRITYNPEFIALGDIVNGIENPDFVLIGYKYEPDLFMIASIYNKITNAEIKSMFLTEAEITKIALNSYLTTKITFANLIGELCEKQFLNSDIVLDAIGTDSRIGKRLLKSGTAFSGPCLPRDNQAFINVLDKYQVPNYLQQSVININNNQVIRISQRILNHIADLKINILISGTSYKPDSPYDYGSPAIKLKRVLEFMGAKVELFDDYKHNIKDLRNSLKNKDLLILMQDSKLNKSIKKEDLKNMKHKRVLDVWRCNELDVDYFYMGK